MRASWHFNWLLSSWMQLNEMDYCLRIFLYMTGSEPSVLIIGPHSLVLVSFVPLTCCNSEHNGRWYFTGPAASIHWCRPGWLWRSIYSNQTPIYRNNSASWSRSELEPVAGNSSTIIHRSILSAICGPFVRQLWIKFLMCQKERIYTAWTAYSSLNRLEARPDQTVQITSIPTIRPVINNLTVVWPSLGWRLMVLFENSIRFN